MGLRLDLGAFHQLTLTEVNVFHAINAYNKENKTIECLGADVGGSKKSGDPHGHVGELETNLERAGLASVCLETQPSLSEPDPPAETCRYRQPCKLAHSAAGLQSVGGTWWWRHCRYLSSSHAHSMPTR